MKTTKAIADELANRSSIEKKKVDISGESIEAQLAAQRVQIEKLRATWKLKKAQVDQLKVRAGASGVLQQLPVEVGQRLTPGTVLAKIAQPSKLKAELKVPETQAKDVLLGQVVEDRYAEWFHSGPCEPHRSRGRERDRNRRRSS